MVDQDHVPRHPKGVRHHPGSKTSLLAIVSARLASAISPKALANIGTLLCVVSGPMASVQTGTSVHLHMRSLSRVRTKALPVPPSVKMPINLAEEADLYRLKAKAMARANQLGM